MFQVLNDISSDNDDYFRLFLADDDSDSEPDDDDLTAKTLGSKLEDLVTCNNLVNNHGATLQRSIGELVEKDSTRSSTDSIESKSAKDDTAAKVKGINEKAQLFRITSNAMINVSLCCFFTLC